MWFFTQWSHSEPEGRTLGTPRMGPVPEHLQQAQWPCGGFSAEPLTNGTVLHPTCLCWELGEDPPQPSRSSSPRGIHLHGAHFIFRGKHCPQQHGTARGRSRCCLPPLPTVPCRSKPCHAVLCCSEPCHAVPRRAIPNRAVPWPAARCGLPELSSHPRLPARSSSHPRHARAMRAAPPDAARQWRMIYSSWDSCRK